MLKFNLITGKIYTATIELRSNQSNTSDSSLITFFEGLGFANCSLAPYTDNLRLLTGTWNQANSIANWPDDQYAIDRWTS